MKMSKIALAVAAVGVAVSSNAAVISGGALATMGTNQFDGAGADAGSVPVAIIVAGDIHNALQTMQDLGAACVGNRNKLCAPSISSAELRAILNNSINLASAITSPNGTLSANYGDTTNFSGTAATIAAILHGRSPNVADALTQFVGGGAIGTGPSCGPSVGLENSHPSLNSADDASAIATVSAGFSKTRVSFVHATELDDSNQDYGFVKLDGVAPDLVSHLSANYNLVSNLHGSLPATEKATHGMTVGASASGPTHNFAGAQAACASLDTGGSMADINGGSI